ncbi:MAG TPA: hypothetical protein V6C81_14455 [Planktothrix sp.]|jgi:hypothetical protein
MKFYRSKRGGGFAVEFGPALFVILIMFLIPAINFVQMGLVYCCGWYANHVATREAACAGPTKAQAAADSAVQAWASTGLDSLIHAPVPTNTVVCPTGQDIDGDGKPDFCQCTTVVKATPFFPMPWLTASQVTFQYSDLRPIEEKGLN